MKTPRISPISEVLEDIKCIMPADSYCTLEEYAKLDDPITAVMHMWTQWSKLTQRINFALMLDGYYTFEIDDISKEYIESKLKEFGLKYKKIIRKSIKFIRMINYWIVKKWTSKNTEDRITHRGVAACIFQNMKEGQVFRAMHFQWSSEDDTISKGFARWDEGLDKNNNKTLVHFQIPKGCFNAGKISKYACDKYKHQLFKFF